MRDKRTNEQHIEDSLDDKGLPFNAEPPAWLTDRIMAKVAGERIRRPRILLPVLSAAAAVMLIIGSGVLLMQNRTRTIEITLDACDAQSVSLIGEFNHWDPSAGRMQRVPGCTWKTTVSVPEGRYRYQFIIDGVRYIPDPSAAECVSDRFGGTNSILDVSGGYNRSIFQKEEVL